MGVAYGAVRELHTLMYMFISLQSVSTQRVPVVVVFTHMDKLKTKEQRDEFRRQRTHWLEMHNKRVCCRVISLSCYWSSHDQHLLSRDQLVSFVVT